MDKQTHRDNEQFADDVLAIARALWPSAQFHGATFLDGREVDGAFVTEDCVHLIESTTSRQLYKAQYDVEKLHQNITRLRRKSGTRAVRGWFITKDEPTADQRKVTDKYRQDVNSLSIEQFRSRLINSSGYLAARNEHAFGSVRDPATGTINPTIEYVPLDLIKLKDGTIVSPSDLCELVSSGQTVVLLGDYGAGKSMTLRHVYQTLRKRHLTGRDKRFPIYLNLRDHYGQVDTSEILERHARSIGFPTPSHIVRAWRAGYVYLLIDGFDEVASITIQGLWRRLQDNRFRSMEMVRRLIRESRDHTGIVLVGRAHFFDSTRERHRALGLTGTFTELSLNDFTLEQIDTYLARVGIQTAVPSWLPSRPLLLGYLAAKGILREVLKRGIDRDDIGPAAGWDTLLDSVCDREAEIEAGIDGATVRQILERLASKARASQGSLGALGPDSVVEAFRQVCGYDPDERGMVLLQRLPGLGVDREEENSRTFIDESFADACRAGDLARFVESPYDFPVSVLSDLESPIGRLGIEVAAYRLARKGCSSGKINDSLRAAGSKGVPYLVSDIVRVLVECGFSIDNAVQIEKLLIPCFEVDGPNVDMSSVSFRDCFFYRVEVGQEIESAMQPTFQECYINELDGRVSIGDLPPGMFDSKCHIEDFVESAETTAKVLSLDLPLGTRVCITILKKMYEQRGAGRKESALHRGLDSHARRLVSDVLRVLQSEGLAFRDKSKGTVIWRPDRRRRARVGKMMAAPTRSNDPAFQRCGAL